MYIENLTKKQYIYCENDVAGTDYYRAFCAGIESKRQFKFHQLLDGQAFVEINTSPAAPLTSDYVETQTGALNYQIGWNVFGCYSDGTGSQ